MIHLISDVLFPLKEEARREAYIYFDTHIRRLPRNKDGDFNLLSPGFDDNDVDAFRHAYVSGAFTQEFGEKAAEILGLLVEYAPEALYSNSVSPKSRNMDLWNNKVGRKYGKTTKGRKRLLKLIHEAMKRGELILNLNDSRKYAGISEVPKRISRPIISLAKSPSGRNQQFYDLNKRASLSRTELVTQIKEGEYPGYSVKVIRGIETPVSKRDSKKTNNIG